MQVAVFDADGKYDLERQVNEWLKKIEQDGYFKIVNIQYTAYPCGYGSQHCAMIVYERRVL